MRIHKLLAISILLALISAGSSTAPSSFNVIDFGAKGDGSTLCTRAIQNAIEACAAAGGGRVEIPPGKFLSGTLHLRSGVDLHLDDGATLLGSPHLADYPNNLPDAPPTWHEIHHGKGRVLRKDYELALIRAQDVHDISITGEGTINGNGRAKDFAKTSDDPQRPRVLDFVDCKNVAVTGVTLRDSAFWVERYVGCTHVRVRGIHVLSHANLNNDGIDMDADDVIIEDSSFDSDDDAICLKSNLQQPCRNVIVRNCSAASNCNAIKCGTASTGGFENISIDHVIVHAASVHKLKKRSTGLAGIALEIVDGGKMDNVTVSNINIDGVQTPIFIRLGNRGIKYPGETSEPPIGSLTNIVLRNITATCEGPIPSSITGIPGHNADGIRLEHIILNYPGKGTAAETKAKVPEVEKEYPENNMFGPSLPAYGLYVRHANNVMIDDLQLHLAEDDHRPALLFDDSSQIALRRLQIAAPTRDQPAIRIVQSNNIDITGCSLLGQCEAFAALSGDTTRAIQLWGNSIGNVRPVQRSAEVQPAAVSEAAPQQ